MPARVVSKKTSTFHDFPYSSPERKCFHCWIINVTPPGPAHCLHQCVYCYAREAVYSDYSDGPVVYGNLPELVERDLRRMSLCPPVSLSNVSDPCQSVPEVRAQTSALVKLLIEYGISFGVTTKGDARFLLEIPGFAEYPRKSVAVTIEGTAEMLARLSPEAPSFEDRIASVAELSRCGVYTVVRLDPAFPQLFSALYGERWHDVAASLMDVFTAASVRHVVVSTGRLMKTRRSQPGCRTGSWNAVRDVIRSISPDAAASFEREYEYVKYWAGGGYLLRRDLRVAFHQRLRQLAEVRGMTHASCQELSAEESDSPGIPHCEGMALPFVSRSTDGRFYPVPDCTANCHVTCVGLAVPPCGRKELVSPKPVRLSALR
ncbi:MAG: hypothetical protein AB1597_09290 [Chloroflexota bacterium]